MHSGGSIQSGEEVRRLCRSGELSGPTCGLAPGYEQANLVILPAELAASFREFCKLNPKPCPLLDVTEPGSFEPVGVAAGADLRSDLPCYRVYRNGECVESPTSIHHVWRDDFVSFLIGCSFTFELALAAAGIPVRHIEMGCNVPMYRTNISCKASGPFSGPLVVSMRPMTAQQAEEAGRVTSGFGEAHGKPVHVGDPLAIGISDLSRPDYGDPVRIDANEVPVFWACGVTPVEAIVRARPEIAVTHEPGHMFVTDLSIGSTGRGRASL